MYDLSVIVSVPPSTTSKTDNKIVMRHTYMKVSQGVQRWPMELIKGGFIVAMKKPFTSAY